jgi:hypothetical protein
MTETSKWWNYRSDCADGKTTLAARDIVFYTPGVRFRCRMTRFTVIPTDKVQGGAGTLPNEFRLAPDAPKREASDVLRLLPVTGEPCDVVGTATLDADGKAVIEVTGAAMPEHEKVMREMLRWSASELERYWHHKPLGEQPGGTLALHEYTFPCPIGQGIENAGALSGLYTSLMERFRSQGVRVSELAFNRSRAILRCGRELTEDERGRFKAVFASFGLLAHENPENPLPRVEHIRTNPGLRRVLESLVADETSIPREEIETWSPDKLDAAEAALQGARLITSAPAWREELRARLGDDLERLWPVAASKPASALSEGDVQAILDLVGDGLSHYKPPEHAVVSRVRGFVDEHTELKAQVEEALRQRAAQKAGADEIRTKFAALRAESDMYGAQVVSEEAFKARLRLALGLDADAGHPAIEAALRQRLQGDAVEPSSGPGDTHSPQPGGINIAGEPEHTTDPEHATAADIAAAAVPAGSIEPLGDGTIVAHAKPRKSKRERGS